MERGKNGGAAYGGGLTARRQRINSKVLEERVDRGLAEALKTEHVDRGLAEVWNGSALTEAWQNREGTCKYR